MASDPNTDDLFASLGGSLMKDLWADLQVDGDDGDDGIGWSLEQLERELAHLEDDTLPLDLNLGTSIPSAHMPFSPPGMSAASMVVSHQERALLNAPLLATPVPMTNNNTNLSGPDAWSQSLQKFTALSLEHDFLAADSARKQRPAHLEFLTQAEDYNVSEPMTLPRPPGMNDNNNKNDTTKTATTTSTTPMKPPGIPTPQSMKPVITANVEDAPLLPDDNGKEEEEQSPVESPTTVAPSQPTAEQRQGPSPPVLPPFHPPAASAVASAPVVMGPPMVMPMPALPMGMPPTWQQPPPMPIMPTHHRVYCQVHPSAPPIPAVALESSLMKSRDLAYVIHSILKPILLAGTAPTDYDMRLLRKLGQGPNANPNNGVANNDTTSIRGEIESRTAKSKEWMGEHSTLGHVAKTDVTRPRALIATPAANSSETSGELSKDRQILWKARLYVDQGYQAYHRVLEAWQSAPPGTVPPQVQPHLLKLLKCLGIQPTPPPSIYYTRTSEEALGLFLKLPKGQTLLARILEQALLPPNAVQTLLPEALQVALIATTPSSPEEMRLFRSFTTVISNLPNMDGSCLLQSVRVGQANAKAVLTSTARMECLHALLRRGHVMAQQDPSFATEWSKAEEEFIAMLG